MVRKTAAFGVICALTLIASSLSATTAVALTPNTAVDIDEGTSIGVSSTNPGALDEMDSWWRQGWGNSLTPQYTLNPPSDEASTGLVTGMLYSITPDEATIDPDLPQNYYRTARGSATNLDQTIDLLGIYNFPPPGGWRSVIETGAASQLEGHWHFNVLWFTSMGFCSTMTYNIPMNYDGTPPSEIASLAVSPTTSEDDTTTILPTSRAHIMWKLQEYDTLAGVGYYQVLLDGTEQIPDGPSNPPQGRVYVLPGFHPNSVTIESLPAGKHTIGVRAVDRATNAGPTSSIVIYSDPDTPTITITRPSGSWIGVKPALRVSASDRGGIQHVVYKLDGRTIATSMVSPYSANPSLSSFPAGKHVLSATVTDRYGRTATHTKEVRLDKSAPRISARAYVTKRKVTIKAHTSEAGRLVFAYNTGSGSRTFTRSMSKAGTKSISVTLPRVSDTSREYYFGRRVSWAVYALDYAENASSLRSGKVTVRYFRVVRLAGNKVKIVKN